MLGQVAMETGWLVQHSGGSSGEEMGWERVDGCAAPEVRFRDHGMGQFHSDPHPSYSSTVASGGGLLKSQTDRQAQRGGGAAKGREKMGWGLTKRI